MFKYLNLNELSVNYIKMTGILKILAYGYVGIAGVLAVGAIVQAVDYGIYYTKSDIPPIVETLGGDTCAGINNFSGQNKSLIGRLSEANEQLDVHTERIWTLPFWTYEVDPEPKEARKVLADALQVAVEHSDQLGYQSDYYIESISGLLTQIPVQKEASPEAMTEYRERLGYVIETAEEQCRANFYMNNDQANADTLIQKKQDLGDMVLWNAMWWITSFTGGSRIVIKGLFEE